MDRQHAVTSEEADEEAGGAGQHRRRFGRPDRSSHWDDVTFDELARVAAAAKIFAERERRIRIDMKRLRFAIEAQDLSEHAQKRRPYQIAALCEQRIERRAVVLEPGALATQAEAHVRGLP